jgi:glutamyl-tRNA reductase
MILAEVNKYQRRMHALNIRPEIMQLLQSAEQIRRAEMRRLGGRLHSLSPEQQAAVEALTKGLINKFLHQPLQAIKAAANDGNAAAVEAIREAFGVKASGEMEEDDEVFEDVTAALDRDRDPEDFHH